MDVTFDCEFGVEQVHVRVFPKDRKEGDEKVDGAITVEVATGDGTVVSIDEDGLGFRMKPGSVSISTFNVKADDDLTEATEFISAIVTLNGKTPKASNLEFTGETELLPS